MKNGAEVIKWIQGLLPFGIKPGLERMEWMLERLEQPEKKVKAVHIAGTNGKGSTVSFLRHVLVEAGYKVGSFTSPSIEMFEDRISVNGQAIAEEDLVISAERIRPLVDELSGTELGSPTEFEVLTAMAFDYFAYRSKPDIVLIEVGLGGRLDSTNVLTPILSIITSIGFDHMQILGNTLPEIAAEKAGIIKNGVPVVSGVSAIEAQVVIQATATEQRADLYQLGKDFVESLVTKTEEKQMFTFEQIEQEPFDVTIQMPGPHQRENAAVAICALHVLTTNYHFKVKKQDIQNGLLLTTWPGRFERIQEGPIVVLDGAHNKEGMESLANTLKLHYPSKSYRFLVAATKDKEMSILLQPFIDFKAHFTFTSFDFDRAARGIDLFTQALMPEKRYKEEWEEALTEELRITSDDEILVICGSLYFIARVRDKWRSLITSSD